ncbi:hypothetical protein KFU94_02855 [Chloroflexi bacterium TSY]|nr:hypothetical protein [Chloroflexi bacterium TSY]
MTPKSLQSRLKIAKNAKFGSTEYGFLFQDMGYASAMSIATLFLLLLISLVQMRLFRSDVEY